MYLLKIKHKLKQPQALSISNILTFLFGEKCTIRKEMRIIYFSNRYVIEIKLKTRRLIFSNN